MMIDVYAFGLATAHATRRVSLSGDLRSQRVTPSWRARIFSTDGAQCEGEFTMAKTTKGKTGSGSEPPKNDDDTFYHDDSGETIVDPNEPPPIDETDSYYSHDGADGPDVDYLPDEEESANEGTSNPLAAGSLLRPEELKYLRDTAERMRHPLSYMKCSDHGYYTINEKDVSESKVLAITDYLAVQRTLFVKGKGVEAHGYFMKDLKGEPPPRPKTFTDRARWPEHHSKGKDSDPWLNISQILAFQSAGGGIISFQANSVATKAAIGELIAAFVADGGKRRPIVALSSDENPETGERFPVLRFIKWVESNEDFSFLREMLLRDDPEFPEPPKEKPWTGFGNE
jgi:hypothetical protein